MQGSLQLTGTLFARKLSNRPPLAWRISNTLRVSFLWGWFVAVLAYWFSRLTGAVTITSELRAVLFRKDGSVVKYGVLSRRLITTAGVGYMVDAWQNTVEPENMKYHGCGTGVGAEAAGDTALGTECTTALNPDSTRATGTTEEGASANIFKSVGTLTFDASAAVTEHGLLSQAATGGGVLWDRSVFAAINVGSGDSIQFTYQATLSSGG